MDAFSLFEKLANTVHHKQEVNLLISQLPTKLRMAALENNSQQLRIDLSDQIFFADSKTIAQANY